MPYIYLILFFLIVFNVSAETCKDCLYIELENYTVDIHLINVSQDSAVYNVISGVEYLTLENLSSVSELIEHIETLRALEGGYMERQIITLDLYYNDDITVCNNLEVYIIGLFGAILIIGLVYWSWGSLMDNDKSSFALSIIIIVLASFLIASNITYLNTICY